MGGRVYQKFYDRCADAYGEDRIFERVADGDTIAAIQRDIWKFMLDKGWDKENPRPAEEDFSGRLIPKTTFSRQLFYGWLKRGPKDEQGQPLRYQRNESLRGAKADSLTDQAQELLDGATLADIPVKREQAKFRQWLAGKANPERYGEKQMSVQINMGNLHLDALRQRTVIDVKQDKALANPEPDFEVVEDGDAEE